MEAFEPVAGVRHEEGAHLRLSVVKNARRPVGMLVHHRVGKLVAARAVKLVKTVLVLREMRRDPVEDHAEALPVAFIHEAHQLLRRAVAVRRRVIARHLIAPRRVVGIFHDRQQLDMRIAHVLDIGDQLRRQIVPAVGAPVGMALPGAGVNLIDVERPVQRVLLLPARAVRAVVPGEAVRRLQHAGGVRQRLAARAVGVGLIDLPPVLAGHAVFIGSAGLRINRKSLPDAVRDLLHGQILLIPEIEIPDHADRLGLRRPDAEHRAAVCEMAAHIPERIRAAGGVKLFEKMLQAFRHPTLSPFGGYISVFIIQFSL